jgi:hypothetical protein
MNPPRHDSSQLHAPRFSLSFLLLELTLFASAFAALAACVRDWYADYFDPFPPALLVIFLSAAIGGLCRRIIVGLQLGLVLAAIVAISSAFQPFGC